MEDQDAIDIAEAHLASVGHTSDGYIPKVINPSTNEIEIAFHTNEGEASHRVIVGQFGHFIGAVLDDGTRPSEARRSELKRIKGEGHVEAATRYLQALDIDTHHLTAQLVEPTQIVVVWYDRDTEETIMGGGGAEVYITGDGIVAGMWFAQ